MRSYLAILTFLCVGASGFAAENPKAAPAGKSESSETLVQGNIESGGYGAPAVKYTHMSGADGMLVGGEGGWIINHNFVLGGAGYGLTNSVEQNSNSMSMAYGGILFQYFHQPEKLLHMGGSLLIGAGGATIHHVTGDENHSFFVAEPELMGIVNISSLVRAGLSVGYRWAPNVSIPSVSVSSLSGVTAGLFVQVGTF